MNRQKGPMYEQVAREIALHVITENATNLPIESELCRSLSVSRTVIREAIKTLSAKGLVEVSPKRGTTVRPREKWNLLDSKVMEWQVAAGLNDELFIRNLCEVRRFLEPAVAALAAERATSEEIEQLYWHLDEMQVNVHNDDSFIAADMKFHGTIFLASRNDLLRHIADAIDAALRASRSITVRRPGSSEASMPLHRNVADAIRDRDPDAARAAMILVVTGATRDIYQVQHPKLEEQ
ncbi:MAG: FadR/GntR family transcriptional regulator [Bryobacteraceae bacterium]